ncbi:hypothetical protein PISL3812_00209 [Talaromyces islandicus]|uniref:Uncharacterized protein n=1 Tax=Talaromyces islandicus TaxID=28573 RepID=A0A0U1LIM2_TALIS|nr:hypothetical protein PISL3812_00209 [Talaromyces islandicus]
MLRMPSPRLHRAATHVGSFPASFFSVSLASSVVNEHVFFFLVIALTSTSTTSSTFVAQLLLVYPPPLIHPKYLSTAHEPTSELTYSFCQARACQFFFLTLEGLLVHWLDSPAGLWQTAASCENRIIRPITFLSKTRREKKTASFDSRTCHQGQS